MQFSQTTITIATKDGPIDGVEVTVGEGSGLAYHVNADGYSVTAIASGYVVVHTDRLVTYRNLDDALDETILQHFIENIADLLDWHQQDPQVVIQQAKARYPGRWGVFNEMKKAFNKAKQQTTAQEVQA
jgi:hypothetical protein